MQHVLPVLSHALLITGFVAVIMLVIEYVNVVSRGAWQERLSGHRIGQVALAALLGVTPGGLGAFAVVAMYTHRRMTLGSVVAAMIATSGDESFVMFALVPRAALLVHGALFLLGLAAGILTDALAGPRLTAFLSCREDFRLHEEEPRRMFSADRFLAEWRKCSPARGTLSFLLLGFLSLVVLGKIGPEQWDWIRVTLLVTSGVGLFIVATVPEHFLEEHLWKHVVRQHAPRIFLWTFGALFLMDLIVHYWRIGEAIQGSRWIILALAALVGLVPESGPHLIFVTLFSQGLVPFGTLLASSLVQDGHGMLPLLAHSRKTFVVVKLINLLLGLAVGAVFLALGP